MAMPIDSRVVALIESYGREHRNLRGYEQIEGILREISELNLPRYCEMTIKKYLQKNGDYNPGTRGGARTGRKGRNYQGEKCGVKARKELMIYQSADTID